MDEKLRLVVELQNKASAELRKITREMGGVKQTPGMLQARTWFTQLETASAASTKTLRPLVGGLNMVGAGSLAAGLSVAGLVSQFRDLARALPALQELSRQSGISRTEIERLKQTASNLNVDPSKITASISGFSRMMVDFHRQSGEVYAQMQVGASGLAEKIRKEGPADAYKDILRWLDAIPAAQMRAGKSAADAAQIQRYWAGKALGDEDVAQLLSKGMGGFQEAYSQAAQDVGEITDEMVKQAEAFDRSISRFDRSWETLKQDLGTTVLPGLTAATDAMRALFDEVKRDPELLAIGAGAVGAMALRRRIMRGAGAGGVSSAAAAKIEGAAIEQKSASVSFAEAVAEFRVAVREMAARGAGPGGDATGQAVREAEKNAAKLAPGALPFMGAGTMAGVGAVILGGGAAAGAMDAPMVDEYGRVVGNWGGADQPWGGAPGGRSPAAVGTFHPDDDRLTRARASDAPDRTLDGFVMGALEKPILHLSGTLKTASAVVDGNFRPAAFHPATLGGASSAIDPQGIIAAGTKEGVLAAFREWASLSDVSKSAAGEGGGLMSVSYGGGAGGGGGSRNPVLGGGSFGGGGGSYGNPSKSLLDFIAKSEGGGYNVSWGNGRFMPEGHEQNLTGKTLNEILALGNYMRQQPGSRNSSAMGRYQITGSTLRDLMKRLGLNGSEKYDEAMQDRLASKLISDEGPRALQRWEGLKIGGRMSTALGLLRSGQIASQPAAIVSSGPRGAYPAWMDEKSRREMAGINAPLARDLLAASQETGLRFRVLQGLRTPEEAAHNAMTGRGVFNSQHRWGAAADIVMQDAQGRDLPQDRASYVAFARAFVAHSRASGGNARWLGDLGGRWGRDIVHFDQGLGYGQSHGRDPFGAGGPTAADVLAGNKEIFSGPNNPFLKAARPIERAADKLKEAVRPLPEVRPALKVNPTGGQRVEMDPLHIHLTHQENGRTRVAAKHGVGVKMSIRTAPTMVQTA